MGQQFKVGGRGKTRGGLAYRVTEIRPNGSVRTEITMGDGRLLPFFHDPDGRLNVSDDPRYWLKPSGSLVSRLLAKLRPSLSTNEGGR